MNISPSNLSPNMLLNEGFHQNHQAVLAALSINGLTVAWQLKATTRRVSLPGSTIYVLEPMLYPVRLSSYN